MVEVSGFRAFRALRFGPQGFEHRRVGFQALVLGTSRYLASKKGARTIKIVFLAPSRLRVTFVHPSWVLSWTQPAHLGW